MKNAPFIHVAAFRANHDECERQTEAGEPTSSHSHDPPQNELHFYELPTFHPGGTADRLRVADHSPENDANGFLPIGRYNVFMSDGQMSLLYARVEAVLAGEIAKGDLKVGDQLPTEDSLVARFGVSRITVRRAIQNLVTRGLVEIRRGKGTFVAAAKITQELTELSGFVEDMQALGRKPTARIIGKEIVTADATVASQLALTKGERVVRIHRVRLADGIPLSFDETFLPLEIGKKVITNNLKVEPIFSLLERKYDVPLIEAEYKLDAVAADAQVAAALKIKQGSPVFRIERTSYSTGGRPVDYETLHYRGDLVQFVTRLVRKASY